MLASILAKDNAAPRKAAVISALLLLLLAALAMGAFDTADVVSGPSMAWIAVPLRMLALFVAASAFLRAAGQSWAQVGLARPASLAKAAGLVIAGYFAVALVLGVLKLALLPALGLSFDAQATFAALPGNTALYAFMVVFVAWGSAAFGEELVFRGFLQSRLEIAFGSGRSAKLAALLIQAAAFGALHLYQGAGGALIAGATGLTIGAVYLLAGRNLWPCIVLHGLIDTVSLTALYLGAMPG